MREFVSGSGTLVQMGPAAVRAAIPISDEVRVLHRREDGYVGEWRRLKFIVSQEWHGGQWWLHASVSRRDRNMPTYDDLKHCKRLTIGDGRMAVQVFATADNHVDKSALVGMEVLHLWSPEDADVLPEFSLAGTI